MAPVALQQENSRNPSSGTETANGKHQIPPQLVDILRTRQDQQNPDFVLAGFSMDRQETEALMFSSCNRALQTEPIELVIAAAIDAFKVVFTDLKLLTILCEADTDVDAGEAPGKVYPLTLNQATKAGNGYTNERLRMKAGELGEKEEVVREKEEEMKEMIMLVKDAYRHGLAEEWKSSQYPNDGIDMLFNTFNGEIKEPGGNGLPKKSYKTPVAKLEIATALEQGLLCIKIKYLAANKTVQERIGHWITAFKHSLRSVMHLTQMLEAKIPHPTLQDYPLLQLQTDAELEGVMESCRSQLRGRQLAEIEDIFPCTPMQEGMLVAYLRASHLYQARDTKELNPKYGTASIDNSTLQQAWHEVVQRHQILRTVFVQARVGKRSFLQVVLKSSMSLMTPVSVVDYENESQMLDDDHIPLASLDMLHHFKICQIADGSRLFFRLYMHHAITDGFSASLFFRDLMQALDGTLAYQTQPQQYKAFVSYLGEQDHHASLYFWNDLLSGVSVCKLPSFSGDYLGAPKILRRRVAWTATQTSTIRKVCKHVGISPASFFRSIWALVLRCYTGSDDVCFGTITSGRLIPGSIGIVGPMIANLTCRAQMTTSMSIATLFKTMMKDYGRSLPFQHCSLAEITHNQGLGGELLFNTVVNFMAGHPKDDILETALCTFEYIESYSPTDYDVLLEILDESTHMSMSFNSWRSFIREDEADCIIDTFSQAIASVVADPDQSIGGLNLFSSEDTLKVQSWSRCQYQPTYSTVHQQVSRQAAFRPAKMAVCSTSLNLTYEEIESLTDRLAHMLVESGVRRGSVVPFCMEKSVWATVAMLGVLKAGAAFVPLEPTHPIARLEWLIDEIGADFVLCSCHTIEKVQSLYQNRSNAQNRLKVVLVEDVTSRTPSATPLLPLVDPSDTAYIIFTSGSTGNPKGVIVSHQAACGSMAQCAKAFQMDYKSRVLQFSAYTWDAIVCEIFSTLDCGGVIFVPDEVERMDGLVEFIKKMKLNWLFLTPTVLRLIRPEQVNQKLTIITIGELLGQDLIEIWHNKAVLINAYGPTESCVACTAGVVKKGASSYSIGKPFGSRAWVVLPKDHNRLSPLGSIGELLIEGPNLAKGYFKDKQKTAISFLSHPPQWAAKFDLEASYRFYKTGDLVRQIIDDGSLMFVARKDTQIKINGQRVELGEVEHHLLNSESTSITNAMAMVPKDGPLKSKLVAVLSLPYHGSSTKKNKIPLISPPLHNEVAKEIVRSRRRLENSLPAYMVPTFWLPLTELPVLYSGKIDRSQVSRWLCEPDEKSKEQIQAWVASIDTLDEDQKQPTTPTQEKLQRIWANVLHLPAVKVSVGRSFLKLGGDSILAITVATQSRAAGIPVTVQDLLRRKTIEELASSAELEAPGLQEQNSEQGSKLSPAQAFYFAAGRDQLVHPGLLINLRWPVESDVVLAAFKILVGRHPMLLARFQQDGDEDCKWTQKSADNVQDSWICHAHQLDSAEEIEMVYASSQSNVAIQPGPVFSVDLIHIRRKVPSDYILLTANALIADVESLRIIFEDLEDILQTGAPLQPASMPFQDWIDQQAMTPGAALSTEVTPDYWGLEAGYQNDLTVAGFSMSREETEALMTSCNRALRTEPTDLIIAAVLDAFERVFTDRKLPIIFSERDGRLPLHGDIDITRTVGLFTKLFPIELQPADTAEQQHESGSSSLKEKIMKVKDGLMTAKRTHRRTKAISTNHKPVEVLFRTFNMRQRLGGEGTMLQAKILAEQRHIASIAVFEFAPSLKQDSLVIKLSYPACIPQHEKISKWMEHCKYSLRAMICLTETLEPQPTLQDYPLLGLTSYTDLDKVAKSCQLQLGLQQLAEIEDIYPCSPMQEGILLAQAKASLSIYDQRLTWKIQNHDVDLSKLQDAWQTLVDRHTMLRTVFIEFPLQEHHAAQVVLRQFTANVSRIKCKDIEEFQTIQAHRPESQSKVLHDLVICETQNDDFYCALSFNHILGDATSVQIIVRDLQLAYDGHLESTTLSSYAEFISYLTRQNSREVNQYWETALAGVEACAFQKLTDIDHDNSHLESSSISEQSFEMTTGQISQLRQLGTEFGITTAMLSKTIWAVILRTFLGRDDVCFGYLASGRDIDLPSVQTMLGPLVTLLVCHVNIHPRMRLLDLAQAIQDNYLQSLLAQHYSLAEVYHSLGLQGEHLFNTVVNVVPTGVSAEPGKQPSDQSLSMVPVEIINPSEFDIALDVIYSDCEAKMVLSYRRGYLSESLASSIIATISRILDALLENPEQEVGQLKLCDEVQQQSMSTWEPLDDIESQTCLHETIEQRTKEAPVAEAVCAHDGNFSYHDIWALSNQLAHSLVALGVGPNICVSNNWASVALHLFFCTPCMHSTRSPHVSPLKIISIEKLLTP
jgi:amino acid adenylation domain-containing protein